jgi:hypothetical protein
MRSWASGYCRWVRESSSVGSGPASEFPFSREHIPTVGHTRTVTPSESATDHGELGRSPSPASATGNIKGIEPGGLSSVPPAGIGPTRQVCRTHNWKMGLQAEIHDRSPWLSLRVLRNASLSGQRRLHTPVLSGAPRCCLAQSELGISLLVVPTGHSTWFSLVRLAPPRTLGQISEHRSECPRPPRAPSCARLPVTSASQLRLGFEIDYLDSVVKPGSKFGTVLRASSRRRLDSAVSSVRW